MPVQCPDIQAPGRLLFGTLSGACSFAWTPGRRIDATW